jgi:hypothetical protein
MKLVKWDTFRSEGRGVNKTDDMVRAVIDFTAQEFTKVLRTSDPNSDKSEILENLLETEAKLNHLAKQIEKTRNLILRNNLERPLLSPR